MRPLVWLASYPKSGNTWMRLLFAAYEAERGPERPIDFEALAAFGSASARATFDELAGVESSELTTAEIDALLPAVFAQLAAATPDQRVLKVHDAYRRGPAGTARHPAAIAATVYLVRDPRDVAVSFAHHRGRSIDDTIAFMAQPTAMLARPGEAWLPQLPQPLGSWSAHVASWVDEPGLDALVVRYEDLRRDPTTTFAAVLAHVGRPTDAARVLGAVAATTFERLQALEAAGGFRETPRHRDGPFFRRGRAGDWRDALTAEQAARVEGAHAAAMRRFGYLPAAP